MDKDTAKLIVKILAILSWIGAAFGVIGGIVMMFGGSLIGALGLIPSGFLGLFAGAVIVILGVILIALGILAFFIGRGLWKFKNWARITLIVLEVLGLFNWPTGTIFGVIVIYLLAFNKSITALFK